MHVMIRENDTGAEEWLPLEQAARLMGLAPDDIEWALEEFGEVEAGGYTAIEPD